MPAARHVSFHFTMRDAQGRLLDTSRGNEPLTCVEGAGQIVDGLEAIVRSLQPGETRKVVVPPERGYGMRDETLIQKVRRNQLPVDEVKVGDQFQTGPDRHAPVITIAAIEGDEVTIDANHPLAGQSLYFEVELMAARPATPEEMAQAREQMTE
jgi:FKBP-type peptidyl-prolyl cis-trans isomerase SlyD